MGIIAPLINFDSGPQRKATTPVTSEIWGRSSPKSVFLKLFVFIITWSDKGVSVGDYCFGLFDISCGGEEFSDHVSFNDSWCYGINSNLIRRILQGHDFGEAAQAVLRGTVVGGAGFVRGAGETRQTGDVDDAAAVAALLDQLHAVLERVPGPVHVHVHNSKILLDWYISLSTDVRNHSSIIDQHIQFSVLLFDLKALDQNLQLSYYLLEKAFNLFMLGNIYLNVLAIILSGNFFTGFLISATENNLKLVKQNYEDLTS